MFEDTITAALSTRYVTHPFIGFVDRYEPMIGGCATTMTPNHFAVHTNWHIEYRVVVFNLLGLVHWTTG